LVPTERFIPVKNTSNLLYLRSDLVSLDKNYRLKPLKNIKIELNSKFYKNISDFESKMKVVPSLINATSVKINSEVIFDKPTEISGSYEV
jgi:UTP--glucose-1-phosphate uridylyltransferase